MNHEPQTTLAGNECRHNFAATTTTTTTTAATANATAAAAAPSPPPPPPNVPADGPLYKLLLKSPLPHGAPVCWVRPVPPHCEHGPRRTWRAESARGAASPGSGCLEGGEEEGREEEASRPPSREMIMPSCARLLALCAVQPRWVCPRAGVTRAFIGGRAATIIRTGPARLSARFLVKLFRRFKSPRRKRTKGPGITKGGC